VQDYPGLLHAIPGQMFGLSKRVRIQRAAERGHAESQMWLGHAYQTGRGSRQDYAEAARWYRLAAAQGNAESQCNLGVLYQNGQGVPQDYVEAAKWFHSAAVQGHAIAQFNLAGLYEAGFGVPSDNVEAAKWYRRAADAQAAAEAGRARRARASWVIEASVLGGGVLLAIILTLIYGAKNSAITQPPINITKTDPGYCKELTTETQRDIAAKYIRSLGYDCSVVDDMCPYSFSEGYTVYCNHNRYKFLLENHGGKWSVEAK
jgi:TPR repeat protein